MLIGAAFCGPANVAYFSPSLMIDLIRGGSIHRQDLAAVLPSRTKLDGVTVMESPPLSQIPALVLPSGDTSAPRSVQSVILSFAFHQRSLRLTTIQGYAKDSLDNSILFLASSRFGVFWKQTHMSPLNTLIYRNLSQDNISLLLSVFEHSIIRDQR